MIYYYWLMILVGVLEKGERVLFNLFAYESKFIDGVKEIKNICQHFEVSHQLKTF